MEKKALRKTGVILLHMPWLALLGWLAAVAWFLCDDAFISFRYARNLLEGHGLVFNPGEYVEGYSNFLWVLELAAIWKGLGIAPEYAAPWLSVAFTAGTIAVMTWWIIRLPVLHQRTLVAWMAFGLVCSSATFAVWTSGGGLETRQFTFFVVLAVVCLSLYRSNRWGLVAASVSLAAAAYTRPEGSLIAALCFGWFVIQRMADTGCPATGLARRLMYLAAPFVVLVAAHYLFRYAYYGEWLPNTYYAKHVRPWYESGFRYLWAAALETGLYLLIPLAWVALRQRWRKHQDGSFTLILLLVVAHMAYVMRIGGDHFEYRPLDFYWPLLALPASMGIVHLGSRIASCRWLRLPALRLSMGAQTCAIVLFVPVLFYANAIQSALFFKGAAIRERILKLHIELDDDNAGWLLAAPGMRMLVAISNDLRRLASVQSVASPFTEHRENANSQLRNWKPYETMERGIIPDDALMAGGALGIRFYYLPDLKVIDIFGLTDATVARNPVAKPNHRRVIAHDRQPPPGYLEERGVNFIIYPPASSKSQALERALYAVKVGPSLWMSFDSPDRQWVFDRFVGRGLRVHDYFSEDLAELIEDSQPVIRSDFDVHLIENSLVYVKERCEQDDVEAMFFLHLDPVDVDDLPDHRKQYGFDNLDFSFRKYSRIEGGICLVSRRLPDYDIAAIRTGQYVPGEGRIWEGSLWRFGGHLYVGEQFIGYFEDGFDGWLPVGEAVVNHAQHEHYKGQQPISGNTGQGFLTSYHPDKGDRVTGRALSPAFTAEPGQYLTFLIAGGEGGGVGLRLLADGDEVAVWRGRNTERFRQIVHPLADVAGERLQLELFDDETGGWGHIMLDHVMLTRRSVEDLPQWKRRPSEKPE